MLKSPVRAPSGKARARRAKLRRDAALSSLEYKICLECEKRVKEGNATEGHREVYLAWHGIEVQATFVWKRNADDGTIILVVCVRECHASIC